MARAPSFACLCVSAYVGITPPFIQQYVASVNIRSMHTHSKASVLLVCAVSGLDYAQSSPCVCVYVWLRKLHGNVIVMRIALYVEC